MKRTLKFVNNSVVQFRIELDLVSGLITKTLASNPENQDANWDRFGEKTLAAAIAELGDDFGYLSQVSRDDDCFGNSSGSVGDRQSW